MITFDTFICNKDRSAGNLLISLNDPKQKKKNCEVFLIDHTEAGKGGNWNEDSLRALSTDEEIYVDVVNFNHVSTGMDAFESPLLRLEALTPDIINEIVRGVPSEWRLSLGDAQALTEFLVDRKDKVRPIIAKHLKA